jgi:hypothetical protein
MMTKNKEQVVGKPWCGSMRVARELMLCGRLVRKGEKTKVISGRMTYLEELWYPDPSAVGRFRCRDNY